MAETLARRLLVQRIIEAAKHDERIVGLLDYGSSSEGRVDEWSDVDISVFIRDADIEAFKHDWKTWAAQFGDLLLAYIGGVVGHPWTVYAAERVPLRADFGFHRESSMEEVLTWPNSPLSIEAMVLCDKTGGRLTAYVRQLVGRSLRPQDLATTFDQVCGDFWYYQLFAYCKLQRGQQWLVREIYNTIVVGNLMALLKLEAGALERWQASSPARSIEQVLPPERLARLNACIPGADAASLRHALGVAAKLGQEVCEAIATQNQWAWPKVLAEQTVALLAQ